uniref:Uncharacterized protein n=1 Tax=Leersia perrieri TaxID=77586 RepID=A0A0D9X2K8_9ORYZ
MAENPLFRGPLKPNPNGGQEEEKNGEEKKAEEVVTKKDLKFKYLSEATGPQIQISSDTNRGALHRGAASPSESGS